MIIFFDEIRELPAGDAEAVGIAFQFLMEGVEVPTFELIIIFLSFVLEYLVFLDHGKVSFPSPPGFNRRRNLFWDFVRAGLFEFQERIEIGLLVEDSVCGLELLWHLEAIAVAHLWTVLDRTAFGRTVLLSVL